MNREQYLRFCRRPGIFSESALRLTFKVLRKPRPRLALRIQNILNGVSVPRPTGEGCESLSEHFRVQLSAEELELVVSCLAKAGGWGSGTCPGQQVMLKALLEDWRRLANSHDSEQLAGAQTPTQQ
ncbi:hypothetical protein [Aestuariirhabdus litorea]|uniref:Uncharacterized protein n=1 Tax=Aestuariirhabdus litorea TaxID=2528527 RepID=A0A3P3VKY3_9GAMM|nr:hypothetical protein [Aestuariirhabdus litorea]RRJ83402.1 hypothetical protein D0544_16435 [Aestuariirhabdus litorea]RWW93563.1 hypothetical protein DZC74_16405 [Endozoicomonadaceae bacterium GTF-13]